MTPPARFCRLFDAPKKKEDGHIWFPYYPRGKKKFQYTSVLDITHRATPLQIFLPNITNQTTASFPKSFPSAVICAFFLRLVPVVILHLRRILTCVAVLLELSDFFDNQARGGEGGGKAMDPNRATRDLIWCRDIGRGGPHVQGSLISWGSLISCRGRIRSVRRMHNSFVQLW